MELIEHIRGDDLEILFEAVLKIIDKRRGDGWDTTFVHTPNYRSLWPVLELKAF